jgi:hypothetical protein
MALQETSGAMTAGMKPKTRSLFSLPTWRGHLVFILDKYVRDSSILLGANLFFPCNFLALYKYPIFYAWDFMLGYNYL